jgi:hypothetical protein
MLKVRQLPTFSRTMPLTRLIFREAKAHLRTQGRVHLGKPAIDEINAWNQAGCPPSPGHSKLLHYNGRRALHVIKLSMISAVSRARPFMLPLMISNALEIGSSLLKP